MMERGTGKTTEQMKEAPEGAVFIWCNDNLWYPRDLAKRLQREDLRIKGISALDRFELYGLRVPIIVDHAAELSERQAHLLQALNCRSQTAGE